jgi:hypothetical protein
MEVHMTRTAFLALLLFALVLPGSPAPAQEKAGAPDQAEMMKRWQEYMTPGPEHEAFARMVGTWNVESKVWMNGPGTEPSITPGTAGYSLAMDGRYLVQKVSGTIMGMPTSGMGVTAFDNFKKKFVGTWIDNMGTGILTMEGTRDANGKSITMWGFMDDFTTGEKDKKVKYVLTFVNDDTHIFEIFDVQSYGEKQPMMRYTYTRKK